MRDSFSDLQPLQRARQNLAGLRLDIALIKLRLAAKAGFNPSQPRVPRGRREGGQWTQVGNGSGGAGEGPRSGPAAEPRPASRGPSLPPASAVHDRGGAEELQPVVTIRRSDGSIAEQGTITRDGSAIHSAFSTAPLADGWTERHTVVGRNGNTLTVEAGLGGQRLVANGAVIGETRWTAAGPERQAIVEPAFAARAAEAAVAAVELGLTLFAWLSGQNSADRKAVIAFSARQYVPGAEPSLSLDFVGMLSRDEVDAACPRLGEVQWRTDEAVATVERRGAIDMTASAFGTAVHVNLKKQIDGLFDPNFRAEVSALKTLDEAYGTKDSVRIDVFENVDQATVCVYDIKTGKQRLSRGRSAEIASKVFDSFKAAARIIVIEIRPTR